jgi:hypothetical protein
MLFHAPQLALLLVYETVPDMTNSLDQFGSPAAVHLALDRVVRPNLSIDRVAPERASLATNRYTPERMSFSTGWTSRPGVR